MNDNTTKYYQDGIRTRIAWTEDKIAYHSLSHRVILFIHWFSIDKGQHFILVCLFELMLNPPFNSYVQAETLPPIHEAFIQN